MSPTQAIEQNTTFPNSEETGLIDTTVSSLFGVLRKHFLFKLVSVRKTPNFEPIQEVLEAPVLVNWKPKENGPKNTSKLNAVMVRKIVNDSR